MIVVTTNEVPGHRIVAVHGEVMGLTVRSRDYGSQWVAGWRSLGGGELPEFTQMLHEGRMQVMARMVDEALALGANAVVAMRFDSSQVGQTWTEVCAYGTAVTIQNLDPSRPPAVQGRPLPPPGFTPPMGPPAGPPMGPR